MGGVRNHRGAARTPSPAGNAGRGCERDGRSSVGVFTLLESAVGEAL